MHVLHIVGTRPQLIKLAVVHQALAAIGARRQTVIDTGQHFDPSMSTVFFDELGIPLPDVNLGIHSLSHGAMIGRTLEAIEQLLLDKRPDRVVIYGDTNATLAGAIAAARLHLPLAHIEAGLRSFDRRGPEEQNRLCADQLSDRLYAPTPVAVANLEREGFDAARIVQTGDVMYDCARRFGERARNQSTILARLGVADGGYVLCTAHRAETTDDPIRLRRLFIELATLSERMAVVLPLHPRTRARLDGLGDGPWRAAIERATAGRDQGLLLTEPVGYLDMTRLEVGAAVIATDSGGVQREAFFHGIPAVVFRPHSEWVELVEAGWTALAPLEEGLPLADVVMGRLGQTGRPVDAFGQGDAAESIAADINNWPLPNQTA